MNLHCSPDINGMNYCIVSIFLILEQDVAHCPWTVLFNVFQGQWGGENDDLQNMKNETTYRWDAIFDLFHAHMV